jgi:hypothetical protein
MFKLHLRYIYTFYSFNEMLGEDVFDEFVELDSAPKRFTLHDQEEGNFIISQIMEDHVGKYAVLTFPGKESIIIHVGDEVELAYDESYDTMGDDNHNVYEGTVSLEWRKD